MDHSDFAEALPQLPDPTQGMGQAIVRRTGLFALHFAFALALLWFHAGYSPVIYSFHVDAYVARSFEDAAAGIALALLPSFWLPFRLARPSQAFAYLIYIFTYLPSCTVGLHATTVPLADQLPFLMTCALTIIVLSLMPPVRPSNVSRYALSYWTLALVLALLAGAILATAAATIGIDTHLRSIDDVYDYRLDLRERIIESNLGFLGYLLPGAGLVLIPGLMCLGIARRQPIWTAASVFMALALYQVNGEKSAVANCVAIAGAYFAWGKGRRAGDYVLAPLRITTTLVLVLFGATAYDALMGDEGRLISTVSIGREFIMTSVLGAYWREFFASNPTGGYAGSGFLGLIFGSQEVYGLPLTRVIGNFYVFNETTNANANFWADAFGHLALPGTILISVVLVAMMRILDWVAGGRDAAIILPWSVPIVVSLSNGSLNTMLLTNGVWFFFILVYLMPMAAPAKLHGAPS